METQHLRVALSDVGRFSRGIVGRSLRPYQLDVARAIVESVLRRRGLSISVEIARQGGKNETSAQIEAYLLNRYQRRGGQIVKAAPTFRPQLITSKQRLERALQNPLNAGRWRSEHGYMVRLGEARALFFSAESSAQVVGATADLLLEFDEAQDIDIEKHDKDFLPMGATGNATRVYWGTPWDERTLLARMKRAHEEAEAKDGQRRHFRYPWWVVAEHVPAYGRYVEGERARLGERHPLFRTQYALEEVSGGGGFFGAAQRAQLVGDHAPLDRPHDDATYVAGLDVAGADAERLAGPSGDADVRARRPERDSTVLTIGRLDWSLVGDLVLEPRVEVVAHYWWTGRGQRELYESLLDLLRNVWRVERVAVDATGLGAGLADFLRTALGEAVVRPVVFSAATKSRLGYALLAAVNGGRVKLYARTNGPADERHDAWAEFWRQVEAARYEIGANQTLRWFVPESDGHDDFLVSLALLVEAAAGSAVGHAAAVVESTEY